MEKQLEGILLVDKPTGITSHGVVNRIRKFTGVKRVGHTGTLDPLATGLLIILVGRKYTKQQRVFLKQNKEYICTAGLGFSTDTYDLEGKIVKKYEWRKVQAITKQDIVVTINMFIGSIKQTVPPYSAVKIRGKPLYKKARKKTLPKTLPVKTVTIKKIELIDFKKKNDEHKCFFTIKVLCSSGSYIRSLIFDIGKMLGVGATVTALRRMRIGNVSIKKAVLLSKLSSPRDIQKHIVTHL